MCASLPALPSLWMNMQVDLPSAYPCPCSGLRQASWYLAWKLLLCLLDVSIKWLVLLQQHQANDGSLAPSCCALLGVEGIGQVPMGLGRKGHVCLFGDQVGREGEPQS